MEENECAWLYSLDFRTRIIDKIGKPIPGKAGSWCHEGSLFFTPWEMDRDGVGALEDDVAESLILDYGADIKERLEGLELSDDWLFETEITKIEQLHQNDHWKLIYQL